MAGFMRYRFGPGFVGVMMAVAACATAEAAEDAPMVLYEDSWVCATKADYDDALARAGASDSPGLRALHKELRAAGKCMLVDGEEIEDMMAPFVQVTERDGDHIKVRFSIEYYKRIELLHRRFSRVTFSGWTHADRLRDYYAWLNNE